MSLDTLLRSPWFYSSPGPMSLIYYAILILVGAHLLLKRVTYKRHKLLMALTESFFIMGFIILSGDLIWMTICGIRFLPSYPDSLFQVFSVIGRDITGMIFCFLFIGSRFKEKIVSFKQTTFFAYVLLVGFLILDFAIAPDPTFTDWTYAVRQGCSTEHILKSLIFSYGIGKVFSTMLVWSWWKT